MIAFAFNPSKNIKGYEEMQKDSKVYVIKVDDNTVCPEPLQSIHRCKDTARRV